MNLHRLTAQHDFRRANPALRSRRDFLKTASTATLAALAAGAPRSLSAEQVLEKIAPTADRVIVLWMAGGKLVRVHGPFVSDGEVEAVADFWRAQGVPDYVEAVTEEPTDLDGLLDLASAGLSGGRSGDEEADVYAKAIDVVAKAQKASTSFIQRHLRIGYNNAARLIERMEQDGFVSRPDHVGRREVLIDEYGQRR